MPGSFIQNPVIHLRNVNVLLIFLKLIPPYLPAIFDPVRTTSIFANIHLKIKIAQKTRYGIVQKSTSDLLYIGSGTVILHIISVLFGAPFTRLESISTKNDF
jgi:hypothetical protein